MRLNGKRVLVCNCEASMPLDGRAVAAACGAERLDVHTQLCRAQIEGFRRAVAEGGPVLIACQQEAALFRETAEADGVETETLAFVDVRDRGGWSDEGRAATAKIAALLAGAALDTPPPPNVSLRSEGACLVYGRGQTGLDAATRLKDRLDVTLVLTGSDDVTPPRIATFPIARGRVRALSGHLGAFEVELDGFAPMRPSARAELAFEPTRDGARSRCDLVLDLSGGTPLLTGHAKRDGYLRVDPGDPLAVERALLALADLVGEFDKPRYVDFHADLCVHSRARRVGCTRCLDACPAGAIRSDGDVVAIDPHVCAGCGACAAVCPTGAAAYALPPLASLHERLRTMLATFAVAGGRDPIILVHDEAYGADLIDLSARHGRGLPARVVPLAVNEVSTFGLAEFVGAFAFGAAAVSVLLPPQRRPEADHLFTQAGYAEAVLTGLGYGEGRIAILDPADPDALDAALYALDPLPAAARAAFVPMGDKRGLMRLGLDHLHANAPAPVEAIPLPEGAPFGRLAVDVPGCTLCLACVGVCPTGALLDNPERPQLRFLEDACVQCGLCASTCPEHVIRLEPRLAFDETARTPQIVKEEEPFTCVRCGRPFGTKSSVERVVTQLAGKHWMFRTEEHIERMRMCDDCRVNAEFAVGSNPLGLGPRPRPRTTEDDLRERAETARRAANGGGDDPAS